MSRIRKHPKFENIYVAGGGKFQKYLTLNADRNRSVYGEKLIDDGELQYREWNPFRSKLCACICNRIRRLPISRNSNILYLGASTGTTVSHCSDILATGIGNVYAVEFSSRSLRELVQNCADRSNVIPILGDANYPGDYSPFITGTIDVIIQDVAQPNQTEILVKNVNRFLIPEKGSFVFEVKSRSIDTTEEPEEIFKQVEKDLIASGMEITDKIDISSFQEDHCVFFGFKK